MCRYGRWWDLPLTRRETIGGNLSCISERTHDLLPFAVCDTWCRSMIESSQEVNTGKSKDYFSVIVGEVKDVIVHVCSIDVA